MTANFTIYGLKHPVTHEIRYVGLTTTRATDRYRAHCRDARAENPRRHLYKWWQHTVRECGKQPAMIVLERGRGTTSDAGERERFWIKHFRDAGMRLTNATNGGQAWTPEQIERRAAAVRGRVISDEQRAKMSATIRSRGGYVGRNRVITDQEIADIRATYTGKQGQRAAIARAIPYSIATVNRALDPDLWTIPDDIVGVPIELDSVKRPGGNTHFRNTSRGQVLEIRRRYDAGERCVEIADDMGIRLGRVQKIAYRDVFRGIE